MAQEVAGTTRMSCYQRLSPLTLLQWGKKNAWTLFQISRETFKNNMENFPLGIHLPP